MQNKANTSSKLISDIFCNTVKFAGAKRNIKSPTNNFTSSFSMLNNSIEKYRTQQIEAKKDKQAEADKKMKDLQAQQDLSPSGKMMSNFRSFAGKDIMGKLPTIQTAAMANPSINGGAASPIPVSDLPKTASVIRSLSVDHMQSLRELALVNKKLASAQTILLSRKK